MFILRRFLVRFRPHYRQGAAFSVLLLLSTMLTAVNPFFYRELIDRGILQGNVAYLATMLGVIAGTMVVQELLFLWRTSINLRLRKDVFLALRMELYTHLLRLPQRFFSDTHKGRLLSRLTADVDAVQNLLLDQLISFLQNVLIGLFIFGILVTIDWRMVAVAACVLPLLYLIYVLFRKRLSALSKALQEKQEDRMERLQEDLDMVRAIQAYDALDDRRRQAEPILRGVEEARRVLGMNYASASASTSIINVVGLFVIWGMGGLAVAEGRMSIGTLVAISFYLNYIIRLFFSAYYTIVGFQMSSPAARRIFEVLDEPAAEPNAAEPNAAEAADGREPDDVEDVPLRGATIAFRRVSFAYDEAKPVFRDVSFELRPGDLVGVVGLSGQGKTTLAGLLSRFIDPTEGEIELNGKNIRTFRLNAFRRQIGLVPQEDLLFRATIRENIVMGRQDVDEAQLEEACRLARVDAFASRLEYGIDTNVGQRGERLSGGQRKRVLIARALLNRPRLLIFDEATATLDEATERELLESVKALSENRIVLIMTHKMQNLTYVNKVLRVHEGAVEMFDSPASFFAHKSADFPPRTT